MNNTGTPLNAVRDELEWKYDIIGDTAAWTQSVCAIAIRYTGWIPPKCDCTHASQRRRRLHFEYDPNSTGHAHGVKHHGATFQTTPYQNQLIDKLTVHDQQLYSVAQKIFDHQLEAIESEYHIRICESLRNDIDD